MPPAVDNGPIRILSPAKNGANVSFSFNTVPNAYYVVQYNTTVTNANSWLTLTTVLGTGGPVLVQDSTGGSSRFYRVWSP